MLNALAVELIWRRLISIVEEAAVALVRTSFSSVVRELNDFACVMSIRVSPIEQLRARPLTMAESAEVEQTNKTRNVYDDPANGWGEVPVLARAGLPRGHPVAGPLLIEDASSTLPFPAMGSPFETPRTISSSPCRPCRPDRDHCGRSASNPRVPARRFVLVDASVRRW